ncbi:hypothetical protein OHC33_001040 [Knufia fluminis]|uniref:Uncharacterized protein n=1 Tax=Knufia fluminis TaxID=191047 RepID=A0AAN8FG17_9EURO|nr:hypothetical protein OHC33_001040 [Knufia fluminis]
MPKPYSSSGEALHGSTMTKPSVGTECTIAPSAGTDGMHIPKAYLLFPPCEDRPEDPLDTFDEPAKPHKPLPSDYPGWSDAMKQTMALCMSTMLGLSAYQRAIRKNQHPDMPAAWKEQEIQRVERVATNLVIRQVRMNGLLKIVGGQSICRSEFVSVYTRSGLDVKKRNDVEDSFLERSEEDRAYVEEARAYLVSAHVFYKVNYALCPVTES